MTSSADAAVGFVGVGSMGGAMARCVRDAGHRVVAADISKKTLEALVAEADIEPAATPGEVARRSQVVAVVVQDDAQAESVLVATDGILANAGPDHVVLLHSTLSLDGVQRHATLASEAGVPLLDAGVSGRQGHHSVGDLCVMVGGPENAVARARPVLSTYGGLVLHLGAVGAGMRAKLARNAICYSSYLALFEGLAIAEEAGIRREDMDQILEHTGLRSVAMNAYLGLRSTTMRPHDPSDTEAAQTAAFNAKIGRKDVEAAREFARALGLDLHGLDAVIRSMDAVFGAPS
jgi:3-hydroxyisobutyrate dehydrogenase-like beta-hydroxyacid dehydrogenase